MNSRNWLVLGIFGLSGCGHSLKTVYVDESKLLGAQATRPEGMTVPNPPKPLPARQFTLGAIQAETLQNTSSPEVRRTQDDARRAQSQALNTIRRRLTEIYLKQVDLFTRQQTELLGDAEGVRVNEVIPKLHQEFLKYATVRLPLISRLQFLAGIPDSNPKNLPPGANLRPVQKVRWVEANALRNQIKVLDDQYDRTATAILGEAAAMAQNDRLDLLKKIDAYRQEMLNKAMSEALNPLRTKMDLKVLRIEAAPEITLPAEKGQTMQFTPTPTLPPAPQVEFEKSSENAILDRQLLERQLKIWSSINEYQLVKSPHGKARDATKEFEQWRKQQEVGP